MPKYDIEVQLTKENRNVFNLIGVVRVALKKHGVPPEEIDEFSEDICSSNSYGEALRKMTEYVHVN